MSTVVTPTCICGDDDVSIPDLRNKEALRNQGSDQARSALAMMPLAPRPPPHGERPLFFAMVFPASGSHARPSCSSVIKHVLPQGSLARCQGVNELLDTLILELRGD